MGIKLKTLIQNGKAKLTAQGDAALMITFGDSADMSPDPLASARARCITQRASKLMGPAALDCNQSARAVMLCFDPLTLDYPQLIKQLEALDLPTDQQEEAKTINHHLVPLCYDLGEDWDALCRHLNLSRDTLIKLHSKAQYRVAMLGFMPGLPYLHGLDPALAIPRLDTPRKNVRAGMVGISGSMCVIYPAPSPGGWSLIGRCPWRLFCSSPEPKARFIAGDSINFSPISCKEFEDIAQQEGIV